MQRYFLIFCLLCVTSTVSAQAIIGLNEDFNYNTGNLVGQGSWSQVGTTSTNPVQVVDPQSLVPSQLPLGYPGYSTTGGNAVSLIYPGSAAGQFVYKNFTSVYRSGSVYNSFLLRVSAAQTTGSYFTNFTNVPNTPNNNFALVYAKSSGTGFQLGLSKNRTAAPTYSTLPLSFNTVYLVVAKYTIVPNVNNNDSVSLFVFSSGLPATEPVVPTIGPIGYGVAATDTDSLTSLTLRQNGGSATAPTVQMDAIRVSDTWPGASSLPVKLLTFKANVREKNVELAWVTASEQEVQSFEIERSADGIRYESIHSVRPQNSTNGSSYKTLDPFPLDGISYYRLQTKDIGGLSSYSSTVKVQHNAAAGLILTLSPNPIGTEGAVLKHPVVKEAQVYLLDGSGKTVGTFVPSVGSIQTSISLDGLAIGRYQLIYQDGGFQQSLSVLKQ